MKDIPLERIIELIKESISLGQVITKCGFKGYGSHYSYLYKVIRENNIDISHFLGKCHKRGKIFESKIDIEDYFSGKRPIKSDALKKQLIKRGIKEHKCEECGITEWKDKPAPIDLHHIDGNNKNNKLENLKILCPNCHTQTDTYAGKKLRKTRLCACGDKRERGHKFCNQCAAKYQYNHIYNNKLQYDYCKCGKPKYIKSTLCNTCNRKLPKLSCRKTKRPNKEALLELIKTKPFVHIAKMYDVTDNAVRKWCQYYELPYKLKDIKKIKD